MRGFNKLMKASICGVALLLSSSALSQTDERFASSYIEAVGGILIDYQGWRHFDATITVNSANDIEVGVRGANEMTELYRVTDMTGRNIVGMYFDSPVGANGRFDVFFVGTHIQEAGRHMYFGDLYTRTSGAGAPADVNDLMGWTHSGAFHFDSE